MRFKQLVSDDDAVSPVIGVILMVAITVILAAVIASFVLGLGNQASQTSPQASFSIEYDNSTNPGTWDGNLTVTHDSGDSIPQDELYLRGTGFYNFSSENNWTAYNNGGTAVASGSIEGETAVVAGDRADIGAFSDYEIRVVWQSSEGDSSNTFREDTGPDA